MWGSPSWGFCPGFMEWEQVRVLSWQPAGLGIRSFKEGPRTLLSSELLKSFALLIPDSISTDLGLKLLCGNWMLAERSEALESHSGRGEQRPDVPPAYGRPWRFRCRGTESIWSWKERTRRHGISVILPTVMLGIQGQNPFCCWRGIE